MTPLTIPRHGYAGFLRESALRWPGRTALRFQDCAWTYSQLAVLVDEAAARYQLHGVGEGDRVVLLMGNRPEYLVAQFALSRIGAAFTTPNPYWTKPELAKAIAAVEPSAAVAEGRFSALLMGLRILPLPTLQAPERRSVPDAVEYRQSRESYLPFSSGTTGLPKAVRHSAGSLCGGVAQLRAHLALSSTDRLQLALPLCHIFGATMGAAAIASGAELELFERFDLEECLTHVEEQGVTVLPLAGTAAYQLAHLDGLEQRSLDSLRFFMWGGSSLPRQWAETITARTGIGFLCSYGMTEAMSLAFNPVARPAEWSLTSPGFATAGTQWRLTGGDPAEGELEVSGPSVGLGYAGTDNSDWLDGGWFRTGDVARIDPDGRLHIVDRRKDMLKVSGFQVAPTEVEQTLSSHPRVADCGVIGLADERTGETPMALVVRTDAQLTEEALHEWVSQRLATYKRPRRYVFAASVPRAPSGKLLRGEIRTLISRRTHA
jgi:long-chain acyl-CoA synthetase